MICGARGQHVRLRTGDSVGVKRGLPDCGGLSQMRFRRDFPRTWLRRRLRGRHALGAGNGVAGEPGTADGGGARRRRRTCGAGARGWRGYAAGARAGGGAESDWVMRVRLQEALTRYVVEKGSIAVEGISLHSCGDCGR